MGNTQSGKKNEPPAPPPEEKGSNPTHEVQEARPFIRLTILEPNPSGGAYEHTIDVDAHIEVSAFRQELQVLLQLPSYNMKIYSEGGKVPLPTTGTLSDLRISDGDRLMVIRS